MSKNVTAPRRWRSSPDSPPTQLAYVTQPEIDMLVNANIHGSMDGKPNVGPKGIISLDGGGGDYQGSKSSGSKSTSSGGGGGGYGERLKSARDAKDKKEADAKQKAYAAQLAAKHDPGLPIVTTGKHDAEVRKIKAANKKRVLETQARLEADRKKEGERKGKETISTQIKNIIMGGTPTGDDDARTKKDWIDARMVVPGEHKLRTQYNRLKAKYGEGWEKTTQAKELLGYLAGVPTEKGGLLGGRDPEYGGGRAEYDTHGVFITEARRKELEAERQRLLDEIIAGGDLSSILEGITREGTGADLTPDQFYNFTQQLMAADPSYGNLEYKKARPLSSGAGIAAIGKALVSPYSTAATGILEALGDDKKKYGVGTGADIGIQGTGDYLKVKTSYPIVPGSSGSGGLTTGEMLAINKDPWSDPYDNRMLNFDPKNPNKQWLDETSLQTLDPWLNPDIPFSSSKIHPAEYNYGFKLASGEKKRYGPYDYPMHEMVAEGEELSFPISDRIPEYRGEPLDPALLRALKERGEILDPFAMDPRTHQLSYNTDPGNTDPGNTDLTPSPVDPTDPINITFPVMPNQGLTPTINYSQWPQYTRQGIASPNLSSWYNTLQNYYGVG